MLRYILLNNLEYMHTEFVLFEAWDLQTLCFKYCAENPENVVSHSCSNHEEYFKALLMYWLA